MCLEMHRRTCVLRASLCICIYMRVYSDCACMCVRVWAKCSRRNNPNSLYLPSQFSINDGELHCRTARDFSVLVIVIFHRNDESIFSRLN